MSIFSSISNAIFGTVKAVGGIVADTVSAATKSVTDLGNPQPMTRDQVDAMIQKVADSSGHKDYNWKQSIVDLMKLLGLDSSLTARKELATELSCPGDKMGDSAQMNMWLHKTVLQKLAQNGGNIPKELLD